MFTINISIAAERNIDKSTANFVEYMKTLGHPVLNVAIDKESQVAEMLFTTNSPSEVFMMIEQFACEQTPPPESLSDIYFSETIYSIHAVPADAKAEDIVRLLNHNINFGCINRRDTYRVRNFIMMDEESGGDINVPETFKALQSAINILSKKVMGTELLTVVNNQEEVKWPVH